MEQNELKKIYKAFSIEEISSNRNYWFVRTKSGIFFEDFYQNKYISIGWDEFSDINMFRNENEDSIKEKIAKIYPNDKRPGYTLNQIRRFMFDLKKDDIVLIPSVNSSWIAFGIITDEFYTKDVPYILSSNKENPKCTYKKRINVKWIKLLSKNNFDPYMRMLMFTHTTISNVNEYKDFINRILYPIYVSDNKIHLTYNVQTTDNISFTDFYGFLGIISKALELFDNTTDSKFKNDTFNIKTTLNSPGVIEIIAISFGIGLVLATLNTFLFGGSADINILNLGNFKHDTPGLIGSILKFIQESNKNTAELTKLKNEYDIQKRALKLKAPNETQNNNENNQK